MATDSPSIARAMPDLSLRAKGEPVRVLLTTKRYLGRDSVRADVDCPRCGAQRGAECVGRRGPRPRSLHAERWAAWTEANSHRVLAVLPHHASARVERAAHFVTCEATTVEELCAMAASSTVVSTSAQPAAVVDPGAAFADLLDYSSSAGGTP